MSNTEAICLVPSVWVGAGVFPKVVATFNHVGGSFNIFMATTGDVWIIPSFRIWGYMLHVEHIVSSQLWPVSVSHPFSFINSSLGIVGGKHNQKSIIPVFRVVLQNFAYAGFFPNILFYRYVISLLSSGWFVIAVCGSVSVRELVK